jgi:hypothetical protein
MLPGCGDGNDADAKKGEHPEKPAGSFESEEAGDDNGPHDMATWHDADGFVVGNQDAVNLIERTLGSCGPGHFGGKEIPDGRDDEEDQRNRDEILVEISLLFEQECSGPWNDEHQKIGDRHERPEGDPFRHLDDAMVDTGALVDHQVDRKQGDPESIQENGSDDELFHVVRIGEMKKRSPIWSALERCLMGGGLYETTTAFSSGEVRMPISETIGAPLA